MQADLLEWFNRFIEPERDGTKLAVKCRGQLDVVGGPSEAFAYATRGAGDVAGVPSVPYPIAGEAPRCHTVGLQRFER